mmetsp:Transcript_2055/g.8013  ORF Transcript_2055/g.8013 Transcript_2055/m.8013 type:complete len:365 (+) Transcript_2055:1667-2761(+)
MEGGGSRGLRARNAPVRGLVPLALNDHRGAAQPICTQSRAPESPPPPRAETSATAVLRAGRRLARLGRLHKAQLRVHRGNGAGHHARRLCLVAPRQRHGNSAPPPPTSPEQPRALGARAECGRRRAPASADAAAAEHDRVALADCTLWQVHPAQRVAHQHVGPCVVQHQVRVEGCQHPRQLSPQPLEEPVSSIPGAVEEPSAPLRQSWACCCGGIARKEAGVERVHNGHPRIPSHVALEAVPLVNVQVEVQQPATAKTAIKRALRGHGEVVKHAKAVPEPVPGVMEPTAQVDRPRARTGQGQLSGADGACARELHGLQDPPPHRPGGQEAQRGQLQRHHGTESVPQSGEPPPALGPRQLGQGQL